MIAERRAVPPSYKWSVVGMLWCVSLFNYADRQAVFSVFPLLEKEMQLDTVQLGLLGSAFAWVYGLCSPFAGLIVDRISRTRAVLFGLHAWSAICISTGFSRTFTHLFLFRAAEGLGETLYYPASMSLIADYHGKTTRSRAMGLHQTSIYVGTIAGGFLAGLLGQRYGWRWSFYVFGSLGILLGLALHRFLLEPIRGEAEAQPVVCAPMAYKTFLRYLWATPTALLLMAAFVCNNFVAVVLLSWMPKFLYDTFHLDLATSGLVATLFAQVGSMTGAPLGGWAADALRSRSSGGRIMVQAAAALCAVPFVYLSGHARELTLAIVALFFWGLFKGFYDANIWAGLFDVIRPELRGRAVGFMNMVGWLGGGTAPLLIGYFARSLGLGGAISSAAYAYVMGFLLLMLAAKVFAPADVARMEVAGRLGGSYEPR